MRTRPVESVMRRVLIVSKDRETRAPLLAGLAAYDVDGILTSSANGVNEAVASGRSDVVVVDLDKEASSTDVRALLRRIKRARNVPVIAIVPAEMLPSFELLPEIDDFTVSPSSPEEVALRIHRLAGKSGEETGEDIIKRDGMTINLTTCDVKVDGAMMDLTFKEYELLKLMAATPGRVFTRETLLDKIWGYDYFGGDRTVDVHIRRLRAKIEDSGHTFIETVRNIGYKFKAE